MAGKTHIGTKASAIVRLTSPSSPISKGTTVNVVERTPAGSDQPFTMPEKSVLVVTDVVAFNCRNDDGRYVAAVYPADGGSAAIPIYFDTAVDGQQKEMHLTAGVVFADPPKISVSVLSISDLCVELLGYLVKDQ